MVVVVLGAVPMVVCVLVFMLMLMFVFVVVVVLVLSRSVLSLLCCFLSGMLMVLVCGIFPDPRLRIDLSISARDF